MKCLDQQVLIEYAYQLLDEAPAAEVRAHIGQCPGCREKVQQYAQLNGVLDAWKAVEPSPAFDVLVRQRVERQQARRAWWAFGGEGWARGLALAALGIVMVAGALHWAHRHGATPASAKVAIPALHPQHGTPAPPQVASVHHPAAPPVTVKAHHPSRPDSDFGPPLDEKDKQALEDYDLAANFDVLSELPKAEPRVAN